jgi:hypothetical protein
MLGYDMHTALQLDSQLKRVARTGSVTSLQLAKFALRAKLKDLSPHLDKLQCEGGYSLEALAVLGILLGTGTHLQRAVLLFEQFDADATDLMSPQRFIQLLETIAFLCVECLPQLLELSPEQQAYCERARKRVRYAVHRAAADVCGEGPIGREAFLLGLMRHSDWLDPTSVLEVLVKASRIPEIIVHKFSQ